MNKTILMIDNNSKHIELLKNLFTDAALKDEYTFDTFVYSDDEQNKEKLRKIISDYLKTGVLHILVDALLSEEEEETAPSSIDISRLSGISLAKTIKNQFRKNIRVSLVSSYYYNTLNENRKVNNENLLLFKDDFILYKPIFKNSSNKIKINKNESISMMYFTEITRNAQKAQNINIEDYFTDRLDLAFINMAKFGVDIISN